MISRLAREAECLLFVAGEPVSVPELAGFLCADHDAVVSALSDLAADMSARGSGLQLIEIAGGYQFATRAEHALLVGRFLARTASRLSRAALETLAVIAYRQPATAPEVEAVRGVDSGSVIRNLVERRLLAEAGRRKSAGRPVQYVTTPDFLHYFGLNGLGDLPEVEAPTPSDGSAPEVAGSLGEAQE